MSNLQKIQLNNITAPNLSDFAGLTNSTEFFEYQEFMAEDESDDELRASVNCNEYTTPHLEPILATTVIALLNQAEKTLLVLLTEKPFYVNSGTTIHISPCMSDFVTL